MLCSYNDYRLIAETVYYLDKKFHFVNTLLSIITKIIQKVSGEAAKHTQIHFAFLPRPLREGPAHKGDCVICRVNRYRAGLITPVNYRSTERTDHDRSHN